MGRKKIGIFLLSSILCVLFVIMSSVFFPIFFPGHIQHGTIVVFGNTVHEDGMLSNRLKARLDEAIRIAGSGQTIIVSGGTGHEGHNEAVVMATYLHTAGVESKHIQIDSDGYSTRQTCLNLSHNQQIVIVSQRFHLSRAGILCRNAGVDVVGYAYPLFFEWRDVYSFVRECIAIVWEMISLLW